MLDQSTTRGRIIAAALKLAAERPWTDITLLDVAQGAGLTLAELRHEFATKGEVLAAFTRAIDDEVLRGAPGATTAIGSRDALFDIVMSRFDALAPYKPALRSIAKSPMFEPAVLRNLFDAQHWMLQAAGVGTDGVVGGLRVAGLASVYSSVFRTWLEDDDPGLARTMAALDRRLRRGERALARLDDMCAMARRISGVFMGRGRPMPEAGREPGSSAGESV
jgi:ubiquinone biosynthesis protein COQ9